MNNKNLEKSDQQVYGALVGEEEREKTGIELIPSENYVSPAVLETLGSVFTNKYSEGYPGKRYYGGNEFTDQIENLAIDRAKKLFGFDHANVQPLSGSPMNQAVYLGLLEPGDTIMGMDLSHGGHLTHGHPVSHMGKLFNWIRYKTIPEEQGRIDFDELMKLAKEHKPKIVLCGYTSYPRDLDYKEFKKIADEVGAYTMVDAAHISGWIAGGVMNNPVDADFDIMTTTTHKSLRGPRGGMILSNGTVRSPLKKVDKKDYRKFLPTVLDRSVFPGLQGGPHMNNIAGIAVALNEALQPEFNTYAADVLKNAKVLAKSLMDGGAKLITDGTDNHMMVMDCVSAFDADGKEIEKVLDRVGITTNKSPIPDDSNPPFSPSGVRLGTPAATTRGMKEEEMEQLGQYIIETIKHRQDDSYLSDVKSKVEKLCSRFKVPSLN